MAAMTKSPVSVLDVGWAFLKLGVTTYGGAASAAIGDEMVRRRKWITNEEFLTFRSIALVAPGPNSPNLAILIGRHLAGPRGAALAFMAATVPGVVAIVLFGLLALTTHSAIGGTLRGCAAAAVGLAFANALEMTAPWRGDVLRLGLVTATFFAVMALHAPLWLTLVVFVPVALVLLRGKPRATQLQGPRSGSPM
jgi:chromate transporter